MGFQRWKIRLLQTVFRKRQCLDRETGQDGRRGLYTGYGYHPPVEGANMPEVTPEQRAENNRRMALEDSIRNAYVATFMTDESARHFAKEYQLDEDVVAKLLVASRVTTKPSVTLWPVSVRTSQRRAALTCFSRFPPKTFAM